MNKDIYASLDSAWGGCDEECATWFVNRPVSDCVSIDNIKILWNKEEY